MKTKLAPKPWNSPWDRAQEHVRAYKVYLFGHRCAARMSWRALNKAVLNPRTRRSRNGRRIDRATSDRYNDAIFG